MNFPAEKIVNLGIAELIVSAEPVVICTVLGSCISVCLYSPAKKSGGMIHYALPTVPEFKAADALRYGDYAIPQLIQQLCDLTGERPSFFTAKIIGGAESITTPSAQLNVGAGNIEIAREYLAQQRIPIIGEDVGGSNGRKALFHVRSGRLQSAFIGPGFTRPSAEKAIQND